MRKSTWWSKSHEGHPGAIDNHPRHAKRSPGNAVLKDIAPRRGAAIRARKLYADRRLFLDGDGLPIQETTGFGDYSAVSARDSARGRQRAEEPQ